MKKLLLLFIISALSFQSYGQDQNLYQTWYLSSYSNDQGDTNHLVDVIPFLSVEITIEEQINTFTGLACNQYGGEFSYDAPNDLLELVFFDLCICGTCNNPPQSHIDLENDYFEYFFGMEGEFYEYEITTDSGSGNMILTLESVPGFILEYQNVPANFGVDEYASALVKIFPNPVSETLFITSEGTPIQSISIYSISGKRVFTETSSTNQIDVSGLKTGLYFAEIATSEGKSVQKFIKK